MSKLVKKIGLLLIGGKHHILHLIPISKALSEYENAEVTIFVMTKDEHDLCVTILTRLKTENYTICVLTANKVLSNISHKLAILLSNVNVFERLDVLLVVERTSTILRYFSRRLPLFVHIPHGAGDRAKSYDPRIRHFDYVLVAGEKDKRRMLGLDLVSESTCHVTGYIKPYAVKLLDFEKKQIFENNNPTILYNPHFSSKLTSWNEFGLPLLENFSKMRDFNFIFAPHIRLFKKASVKLRGKLESYSKYSNIHIDLGSESSTDMTYTSLADIYLGDVSSQVYEFLSSPKPCVFIDGNKTDWKDNPDYAHWHYGKVCNSQAEILQALESAKHDHSSYKDKQMAGCLAAKGNPEWDPISRAAAKVMSI